MGWLGWRGAAAHATRASMLGVTTSGEGPAGDIFLWYATFPQPLRHEPLVSAAAATRWGEMGGRAQVVAEHVDEVGLLRWRRARG